MNTELSAIMSTDGRLVEFANKATYDNANFTNEDKDIASTLDAWAKDIGKTGYDEGHEISQMIRKAITPEVVETPSALIEKMFDMDSIGEFDDYRGEKDPKNTIKVYDSILGGNVNRSFIDHTVITPTWRSLQAETDISLQALRRGGYRTVANMINFITEAMEMKKLGIIMSIVDAAITSGGENYVNETGTAPTDASIKKLALYLHDITDGQTPFVFGLNKYIQTLASLPSATTYLTDAVKNQYNTTGFINQVAGVELFGLSGQKKLADNTLMVPNNRLFGIAGKIGSATTRGETLVGQETDINSEKIHIKVSGYTFGTMISDIEKVAKMVIA